MNFNDFLKIDESVMNDHKPTTEKDLICDRVKEIVNLGFRTKTAVYDKIKNEKKFRDLSKILKKADQKFSPKDYVEKCFLDCCK